MKIRGSFPSTRKSYAWADRRRVSSPYGLAKRDDAGEMMPAYSEFLGDYGAAAVSRMWWPRQYHTGSAIFVAGSDTVLIDAGINVFHEFRPDIRRWLHFGH